MAEQNKNPIITSDTPFMKDNSSNLGFVPLIGFVYKINRNMITG